MSLPKLIYRADANKQLGFGHISHACRLHALLKQNLVAEVVVLAHENKALFEHLHNKNIKYIFIKSDETDFEAIERVFDVLAPKALAINFSKTQLDQAETLFRQLKQKNIFQIHFDNPLPFSQYADVLINALPHPVYGYDYTSRNDSYSGLDYLLLDEQFLSFAIADIKPIAFPVSNILISLGGSDLRGTASLILEALNHSKYDGKVVLIQGLLNQDRLKTFIKNTNFSFELEVHDHVQSLAPYIFRSDLVFSALGVSTYEVAYCQRPVCIITPNAFQANVADIYALEGAAIHLGEHAAWEVVHLSDALSTWMAKQASFFEMAEKGRMLVDGLGGKRVLAILEKVFN